MNITIVEKILLLLLDDEKGTLPPVPQLTLHFVLAGAVLMELAMRGKIDTDDENILVVDRSAVGEEILDSTLALIASEPENREINFWINKIADDGAELTELGFKRLVEREVLEVNEKHYFWIVKTQTYPIVDDSPERRVKLRIMNILYGDEEPEQKDIVIICLMDACDMFRTILGPTELSKVRARIDEVAQLDEIGQITTKLVRDIQVALVATHAPVF